MEIIDNIGYCEWKEQYEINTSDQLGLIQWADMHIIPRQKNIVWSIHRLRIRIRLQNKTAKTGNDLTKHLIVTIITKFKLK